MKRYGHDLLFDQLVGWIESEWGWQLGEAPGESPIEQLLFRAISVQCDFGKVHQMELFVPRTAEAEADLMKIEIAQSHPLAFTRTDPRLRLIIRPQAELDGRRVDFLIHVLDWRTDKWRWRPLIIECDGHNFHERTKEQAAKDRSKDRSATLSGYEFMRFTGSEIWRDPWGCAEQVSDWAVRWFGP